MTSDVVALTVQERYDAACDAWRRRAAMFWFDNYSVPMRKYLAENNTPLQMAQQEVNDYHAHIEPFPKREDFT